MSGRRDRRVGRGLEHYAFRSGVWCSLTGQPGPILRAKKRPCPTREPRRSARTTGAATASAGYAPRAGRRVGRNRKRNDQRPAGKPIASARGHGLTVSRKGMILDARKKLLGAQALGKKVCHEVGRYGTGGRPAAFRMRRIVDRTTRWHVMAARLGSACSPTSDSPSPSVSTTAGSRGEVAPGGRAYVHSAQ